MLLLVPSDPLRPARPDEHWAAELDAARALGVEVALLDHDAAARGDADAAVRRIPPSPDAVYRGWMLGVRAYEALARALTGRGVTLRTSPDAYRTAHELPGWVAAFAGLAPDAALADGFDRPAFEAALDRLDPGPAVLRDHVKSAKHDWETACYIPDTSDREAAWEIAQNLVRIRGQEATGGLVARRFVALEGPELRSWWVDGRPVGVGLPPDEPAWVEMPVDAGLEAALAEVGERVAALGLPFVTVDLSPGEGRWWVIELGDGQVSDRRRDADPAALIAALAR